MEQLRNSEDSDRAAPSRRKPGVKIAPAVNEDDKKFVKYERAQKQTRPSRQHKSNRGHFPNIRNFVPALKELQKSKARREETKCENKCFFVLLGAFLGALGIGLTFYGVNSDLRDFKILGPSVLIIGFILIVIGLVLIVKDLYVMNKSEDFEVDDEDPAFGYYHMPSLDDKELDKVRNQNMDPYTVTSSSRDDVTSQEAVTTSSDQVVEPRTNSGTPELVVAQQFADCESPIRSVPHPGYNHGFNSEQTKSPSGSTVTVRSKEDSATQSSDSEHQNYRKPSAKSVQTFHVSVSLGADAGTRVHSAPGPRTYTVPRRADSTEHAQPAAEHTALPITAFENEVVNVSEI